jgi:integrase
MDVVSLNGAIQGWDLPHVDVTAGRGRRGCRAIAAWHLPTPGGLLGSWLLAGGADLLVVKERLGHASIVTTERYLHSLPTADETALDALSRIRGPQLVRPA